MQYRSNPAFQFFYNSFHYRANFQANVTEKIKLIKHVTYREKEQRRASPGGTSKPKQQKKNEEVKKIIIIIRLR